MKTKTQTTTTKSGHQGNTSISMKCYFEDIKGFDLLSKEEEVALGRRIQNDGDHEALDQMVSANLKLVVKIANDYSKFGLDVEDLVSEGNIGLMKAAERFDPELGVRFSTYASWWIKQMIKRALGNQSRTIRLPLHVLQSLRDLDRAERELGEELGRDPSSAELARRGSIPRKKVAELRRVSQPVSSLDEFRAQGSDEHQDLEAIIGDEAAPLPSEVAVANDMHQNLTAALACLNEREREVIVSRFGIGGGDSQTLEQVGAVLGVTRERIRQIQKNAIGKLHSALQLREQPVKSERPNKRWSRQFVSPLPSPEAIPA